MTSSSSSESIVDWSPLPQIGYCNQLQQVVTSNIRINIPTRQTDWTEVTAAVSPCTMHHAPAVLCIIRSRRNRLLVTCSFSEHQRYILKYMSSFRQRTWSKPQRVPATSEPTNRTILLSLGVSGRQLPNRYTRYTRTSASQFTPHKPSVPLPVTINNKYRYIPLLLWNVEHKSKLLI